MKNTFGNNISITIYGESHGPVIGAVLDGIPAGIKVSEDYIRKELEMRQPKSEISTDRKESDLFVIKSGVFRGRTNGNSICIEIPNTNVIDRDYDSLAAIARPGHADYTANIKYFGYQDNRGGGHFSGRLTAALVAAGAICKSALEQKGIFIGTHILRCQEIKDREFKNLDKDINELNEKDFAVLNNSIEQPIKDKILKAKEDGDSVGAILQTAIIGVPAGIGEPYFDSVESELSHALFSIPAIKGIEFGMGFDMVNHFGSEVNDAFIVKDEKIETKTNNNAGINGGITNGMPILFNVVVKPTPSIAKLQDTVNYVTKNNIKACVNGRHDPAIFPRARVVVDCLSAIVITDLLITRFGQEYFKCNTD